MKKGIEIKYGVKDGKKKLIKIMESLSGERIDPSSIKSIEEIEEELKKAKSVKDIWKDMMEL